jgi:hypothetical protein
LDRANTLGWCDGRRTSPTSYKLRGIALPFIVLLDTISIVGFICTPIGVRCVTAGVVLSRQIIQVPFF